MATEASNILTMVRTFEQRQKEEELDRQLADKRVFPAIDVTPSGTREEQRLVSAKELESLWALRRVLVALEGGAATELLIAKLKGELKEAKKIKQLNFKVERISLSGDVAAVSEEASYEGQTTEIVKINKIVEKNVSVGSGGDRSSAGSSDNGTIDNRMEAALA